ncbi:MAG: hypothetical protein MJ204_07610 [Bacteroidales bacterium]|nr:hypothetical protein [Bacteroidales bacterium]
MALAIKPIPVLTGKDAERFIAEADLNCKEKGNGLPKERSEKIKKFLEKSRNFSLQ